MMTEYHRRAALAAELGVPLSDIEPAEFGGDNAFAVGGGNQREYLVLTDEEADEAWDESLDSYLDECVLVDLPERTHGYFNRAAWTRDAKGDGRGHSLSTYDGQELCLPIDELLPETEGDDFDYGDLYAYRVN